MRSLALAALVVISQGTAQGPNSSATPYFLPIDPRVRIVAIVTAGDLTDSGYRVTGFPDGLGAFDNGDGTFTLLMNHELPEGSGAVRAHGARGAFVTKLTIRKSDFRVVAGEDLIKRVVTWNPITRTYNPPQTGAPLQRFCSADLPAREALFDPATGLGFDDRMYLNGEEVAEGRAFAHLLDGTSYQLPRLGRSRVENAVARPHASEKTVVVVLDDTEPGQVYVYIGRKTNAGSPIERAGLTNGHLYGVQVLGYPDEVRASGIPSGAAFRLVDLGAIDMLTGAELESQSNSRGITRFLRPEDGAWDPVDPHDFYFATTVRARLWRLHFDDLDRPEIGGRLDMLLTGAEGAIGLDNVTVTRHGQVIVVEDAPGPEHLSRIWQYTPATDELVVLAQADAARFRPGTAAYLTPNEEASGIIDASAILGEGWFLFDAQAHYALPGAVVEGGQLLAMRVGSVKRRAVR